MTEELFFFIVNAAPGEKLLRIVVIKEIKGSQYGVQLESAVRDRLVDVDKYEEEEEEALEKVVEFFQSKYFKKDSAIAFHFPATSPTAEVMTGESEHWVVELTNTAFLSHLILELCMG